jgi:hypothetical protein
MTPQNPAHFDAAKMSRTMRKRCTLTTLTWSATLEQAEKNRSPPMLNLTAVNNVYGLACVGQFGGTPLYITLG